MVARSFAGPTRSSPTITRKRAARTVYDRRGGKRDDALDDIFEGAGDGRRQGFSETEGLALDREDYHEGRQAPQPAGRLHRFHGSEQMAGNTEGALRHGFAMGVETANGPRWGARAHGVDEDHSFVAVPKLEQRGAVGGMFSGGKCPRHQPFRRDRTDGVIAPVAIADTDN